MRACRDARADAVSLHHDGCTKDAIGGLALVITAGPPCLTWPPGPSWRGQSVKSRAVLSRSSVDGKDPSAVFEQAKNHYPSLNSPTLVQHQALWVKPVALSDWTASVRLRWHAAFRASLSSNFGRRVETARPWSNTKLCGSSLLRSRTGPRACTSGGTPRFGQV